MREAVLSYPEVYSLYRYKSSGSVWKMCLVTGGITEGSNMKYLLIKQE